MPIYIPNPSEQNYLIISGVTCPGIAELGNVEDKLNWEIKEGQGIAGAEVIFKNKPPCQFTVTVKLWTVEQIIEWGNFKSLLKIDPTKKQIDALTIYHPFLQGLNIKSVVVESISVPKSDGKGLYTIDIKFIEYFPPKPVKAGKTNKTATDGEAKTPNDKPGETKQKEKRASEKYLEDAKSRSEASENE